MSIWRINQYSSFILIWRDISKIRSCKFDIFTKYDAPLQFDLSNGQAVTFNCNKSAQKKDYEGNPDVDWNGNPVMECLEDIVTKSTVPPIKVGATISIGF